MITIANHTYLSQIKTTNREHGYHWFSKDSLRFFRGKVYEGVYGGCVFVSSEQQSMPYYPTQPRKYSVRVAMSDGTIRSYAFCEYSSKREADKEAKWLGNALRSGKMQWCNDTYEFVGQQAELPLDMESK